MAREASKRGRRGQVLIIMAVLVGVVLMGILVAIYQTQTTELSVRSPVIRETAASITADFKRAVTHMLALSTRCIYNYSRYRRLCDTFYNMSGEVAPGGSWDLRVGRIIAGNYLSNWMLAVAKAYAGYGAAVNYTRIDATIEVFGRSWQVNNLMNAYWLGGIYNGSWVPVAVSAATSRLNLDLKAAGLYGWKSDIIVGLYMLVHEVYLDGNETVIRLNLRYDDGSPYPYLSTRGRIDILYPTPEAEWPWVKVPEEKITSVVYEGRGNYTIRFEPPVEPITLPGPYGGQYIPLLLAVQDERGIVVAALTYPYTVIKIARNPNYPTQYQAPTKWFACEEPFSAMQPSPLDRWELEANGTTRIYGNGVWITLINENNIDPEHDTGTSWVEIIGNPSTRYDKVWRFYFYGGDIFLQSEMGSGSIEYKIVRVLDNGIYRDRILLRFRNVRLVGDLEIGYDYPSGTTKFYNNFDGRVNIELYLYLSSYVRLSNFFPKINLEYSGNNLNMTLPCSNTYSNGSWTLILEKAFEHNIGPNDIVNITLSNNGYLLLLNATAGIAGEDSDSTYIRKVYSHDQSKWIRRDTWGLQSGVTFNRPSDTRYEIYTIEMDWAFNLYWFGNKIFDSSNIFSGLMPPPVPPLPLRIIRVNVSTQNTWNSLREVAVQYERWHNYSFYNFTDMPVGELADPASLMDSETRLVFQVSFPTLNIGEQYVVIWWSDDLDSTPLQGNTDIKVMYGGTESGWPSGSVKYKHVMTSFATFEFVGGDHPMPLDCICGIYCGTGDTCHQSSIVIRKAGSLEGTCNYGTGDILGIIDLHGFHSDGYVPGAFAPLGSWELEWRYPGNYNEYNATVRVLFKLNTTYVKPWTSLDWVPPNPSITGLHKTFVIGGVINGTRYVPYMIAIYWPSDRGNMIEEDSSLKCIYDNNPTGGEVCRGYWSTLLATNFIPSHYMHVKTNGTIVVEEYLGNEYRSVYRDDPGFLAAVWNLTEGWSLILSEEGVQQHNNFPVAPPGGSWGDDKPFFGFSEMYGPDKPAPARANLHFGFWPVRAFRIDSNSGIANNIKYWVVLMNFEPLGGDGWIPVSNPEDGWMNAYVYAHMFLESYMPVVKRTSP